MIVKKNGNRFRKKSPRSLQGLWDQVPKPLRARLCSTRNDLCYDQVRASLLSSTWPADVNIMRMELSKTLCRTEDFFWIHGSFISTILTDSLNCMEWWVKVSVRLCTNRDNIQFQLHQTMSVTRPEPMACIISLILDQFLVWLHPIQSVGNNRSSQNNSKCNF